MSTEEQRFHDLMKRFRSEVQQLKTESRELKRSQMKLTSELELKRKEQTDIFSDFSQSERLAIKNRVERLIQKIDSHLTGS
ncbi:MAG: hypothetical protein DA446_01090 [Bacteroidetes bacterium]|nr:MAG: hypothetical protein DA443_07790 [Bacteroidota bacterium]PTM20794.1 MAG: hypothetical protein DA446_01090 [Bacteroidota bacterium]